MLIANPRPLPATYASLVLKSDALDPDAVTALMGIKPTLSYRAGDTFVVGARKIEQTRRFGLWLYSTRNIVHSTSVKAHIASIEHILCDPVRTWLDSKVNRVAAFVNDHSVDLHVSIYWYGAHGAKPPELSTSLKQVMALAGGSIETDFHNDEAPVSTEAA